ncbi:hypothetical protein QNH14_06430 [Apirhabdus apintestini]|nr:hypothetical protein QNH14_06430 [Enterobacteriaceae bacterium CA-0114]
MTLFRQSLLREQQRQWRGKALIPRGFPVWGITLLTLAFLSAVAALLHFGTLHRKALVSGELVAIPPPVRVTSAWQGTVVRTLVAQGQRVELGAPLYRAGGAAHHAERRCRNAPAARFAAANRSA